MNGKKQWSEENETALVNMASSGVFLNKDIANRLNKSPNLISWKLKQLGIKNTAAQAIMGKWNSKHSHLREPAMRYFLTHTWEETREKFKLTESELKSLFTVGYRDPKLKHLRKDTRRKDGWTAKEFKFLLQHSGLMPRDWIASELNRGGRLGIKDRLEKLGVASKSVNGLTLSQFRVAFGREPEFYLMTKAGPGRGKYSATYFKIIPWVWLEQELRARRLKTHKIFRKLIASMALFQEWVFDGNALKKMKRICK